MEEEEMIIRYFPVSAMRRTALYRDFDDCCNPYIVVNLPFLGQLVVFYRTIRNVRCKDCQDAIDLIDSIGAIDFSIEPYVPWRAFHREHTSMHSHWDEPLQKIHYDNFLY